MSISKAVRARVRDDAGNCCGYCRVSADYVYAHMEIDHIIPISAGGKDDEENLWLACPRCNSYKSDQIEARDAVSKELVKLFHPRLQHWHDHFEWDKKSPAVLHGRTPCGRVTINALQINNAEALNFRQLLVSVGWHPPSD